MTAAGTMIVVGLVALLCTLATAKTVGAAVVMVILSGVIIGIGSGLLVKSATGHKPTRRVW